MSYEIILTEDFKRDAKSLLKKYRSLESDLAGLGLDLKTNPMQGVPLGKDCYKIRLAIKSKGRGKSSGARVITFIKVMNETVYLLAIYDKSEQETVSDEIIEERLQKMGDELE